MAALGFVVAFAFLILGTRGRGSPNAPPQELQGQSFSIAAGNPTSGTGVHPADILTLSGAPLIPCENLGLLCTDTVTGDQDDIQALSFGNDFRDDNLPRLQFSVSAGSLGLAGSAVATETGCSPAEAQADIFETDFNGSNVQDLDGNGRACSSNSGHALWLIEGDPSDNLDSLDQDPCLTVDLDCDGIPEGLIFFSLSAGSPSLDVLGAGPEDILLSGIDYIPIIWADGIGDFGMSPGDSIDALCVDDNGDGVYGPGDRVAFSLAPGSPSLTIVGASPASILRPGLSRVFYTPANIGLQSTDDVDAILCGADFWPLSIYAPIIYR
jgi:hypothetical protein